MVPNRRYGRGRGCSAPDRDSVNPITRLRTICGSERGLRLRRSRALLMLPARQRGGAPASRRRHRPRICPRAPQLMLVAARGNTGRCHWEHRHMHGRCTAVIASRKSSRCRRRHTGSMQARRGRSKWRALRALERPRESARDDPRCIGLVAACGCTSIHHQQGGTAIAEGRGLEHSARFADMVNVSSARLFVVSAILFVARISAGALVHGIV